MWTSWSVKSYHYGYPLHLSLPTATPRTAATPSPPPPQDKISAYYSLVFPHFTFYIQTLAITIGRRCSPNPNVATSSTAEHHAVDVDLGALKSVSRLHAKIEYDQDEDRFVLVVIGRNGAWVDGVWSGAGTRAPLGERHHLHIATFVPASHSPPILDVKPLPPPSPEPPARVLPKAEPPPELPNSNSIGKSSKANAKKRKKGETEPPAPIVRPKPEDMPPKPPFTYAQLIYRAIKDIGGKATLQEICTWIMNTHEYYRYADGAWMSSVRHNLSSGRAFLKMERCGGDRGKGFFWSVDEKYAQALEEQETKAQLAAQAAASGSKDAAISKPSRKKDKAALLEPPLKRSIKGDLKGTPLPPPLTSVPLAFKTSAIQQTPAPPTAINGAATGVFPYPTAQQTADSSAPQQAQQRSFATSSSVSSVNPYASLTQWNLHPTSVCNGVSLHLQFCDRTGPHTIDATTTVSACTWSSASESSHPDYTPGQPNNSAKEGYMVLHERTLILDPNVFSGLTKERLVEIERMGARAALAVLTQHMVKALKERRARERKNKDKDRTGKKAKGEKKKERDKGGVPGSASAPPFTNVPLVGPSSSHSATPGIAASGNTNATPTPTPTPAASVPPSTAPATSDPSAPAPAPLDVVADPGSPLIVVDDSEEEGPAMKRRKIEDGGPSASIVVAT
ncbi:hypothetical protein H1R20_g10890, partial [Candolleomyces eurysporus]